MRIELTSIPLVRNHLKDVAFLFSCFVLWKLVGLSLRHYLVGKKTVVHDIDKLAIPRNDGNRLKGTAIICGGSIAGLWAARICADHFEKVLIVEPEGSLQNEDTFSATDDRKSHHSQTTANITRSRIPQYDATHVFFPLALRALRKFFPDFKAAIQNAGGKVMPTSYLVHIYGGRVMSPCYEDAKDIEDWEEFYTTRDSYERILRSFVLNSSKRIRWLTGTATGLSFCHENQNRVDSVSIRTRTGNDITAPASLVIDCTGGAQAGLKWLKRMSGAAKQQEAIDTVALSHLKKTYKTHIRYQQFTFFVPPDIRELLPIPGGYDDAAFIYSILPRPGLDKIFLIVNRVDDHNIQFYIAGWADPILPKDFTDLRNFFVEFNENERIPTWMISLVDMLLKHREGATKHSGVYPDSSWIQYERAPCIPSNFIAIGDSVMRVNPVFGQGCTKATIGAICLDSILRTSRLWKTTQIPDNFGRAFFVKQADKIADAWESTKPIDYQWHTTDPVIGEKHQDEWLKASIFVLILQLASKDQLVDRTFTQVRVFLAPSTDLLHPTIISKAVFLLMKKRLGLE